MRRMVPGRLASALILAALLAAAGLNAPAAVVPAHAADTSIVFAALTVLTQRHVAIPDPVKLLNAAVGGLRMALSRIANTASLTDLTATDEASARLEFQARFDRAVVLGGGWFGRTTETVLQYIAAGIMASSLNDSHTYFLPPEAWRAIQRRQHGPVSYSGIGITFVNKGGRYYVLEVYLDGPAARAGLHPFDRIIAVDGRTTATMSPRDVLRRTFGPEGSSVALTVQRPGQNNPLTFTIRYANVVVPSLEHRMLDGSIGFMRFRAFVLGSALQFWQALEDLQGQGMRGVVLDLRANEGGSDREFVDIASMFLPPGLPVAVFGERQGGRVDALTTGGSPLHPSTIVTVLIDEHTGSAGELLGAAFQEHARGTLVGMRTAGKVGYTQAFPLPGGAAVTVTIRTVMTGRGVILEKNGVRPDVTVELAMEDLDRGIDTQLQRAVQITVQRISTRGAVAAHRAMPLSGPARPLAGFSP